MGADAPGTKQLGGLQGLCREGKDIVGKWALFYGNGVRATSLPRAG